MRISLPSLASAVALVVTLIGPPVGRNALAADGEIVVYNAQHASLAQAWTDAFTRETGIKVTLRKGSDLDEHTIREELEGNMCRCTGYHNIVRAIATGARGMSKQAAE